MLDELRSDIRYRLRALFQRSAMDRELADEMQFHLDRETEKLARTGMPMNEARRNARLAFGGMEQVALETRDARGLATLDVLRQDLRYAWRGMRNKPGFAAAVILTLGLGIGANTAMFSITDRLLYRQPAMLRDADRVHRVYLTFLTGTRSDTVHTMQYARYRDLANAAHSFDLAAAFSNRTLAIGVGEESKEMPVGVVTGTYFRFFDAKPALGRFFTAEEDSTEARVVVIGHTLWQTRFGGRTDILGKSLQVGELVLTIIGVAPEGFNGVSEGTTIAAFIPVSTYAATFNPEYRTTYTWSWLQVLMRRAPATSLAAGTTDLGAAYLTSWNTQRAETPAIASVEQANPKVIVGHVLLARGPLGGPDARVATWVGGVTWIVLLVACANVANLLLARAVRRRREIALRLALGISRARLVQQLMTETLLLALAGGALALFIGQWGGRLLQTVFLARADTIAVASDTRTLIFVASCTIAVVLLTGIAPLLDAGRQDVATALKAGTREGSYQRSRARSALLFFQATLSVVLLIGAGLFVRSLQHVRQLRLGYDVDPVLLAYGTTRGVKLTEAEHNALANRMLESARSLPGVANAALTVSVPFWSNESAPLFVPGVDSVDKLGRFLLQAASPSYFATTGTRILRGRSFTDADRSTAQPVVVVSDNMARALWPGQDPIGKQFRISSATAAPVTVIGVAESMRGRQLVGEVEHWYYLPLEQYPTNELSLFVRAAGPPDALIEPLRRQLQSLMPGTAYVSVVPLRTIVDPTSRAWRFGATMFVAFGGLALVMAMIGLYSVISYVVAQRTHEFGVRMALGARALDVLRLVLREGVIVAAIGVALGSTIALALGRKLEPLLFEQSARDPVIYGSVGLILVLVALTASLLPGLRATRVNAVTALRAE